MQQAWDDSADLIVAGFGAAGACAAIAAADLGASVILLEKQPRSWHTPSTRASGGQVTAVSDPERALPYFDRCAGGLVPLEVSRAWVQSAATVVAWVERVLGLKMTRLIGAEHPEWPGSEAVSAWGAAEAYPFGERSRDVQQTMSAAERARLAPAPRGGEVLFQALSAAVEKRERIRVLYECPANRLIRDSDGRIAGVQADSSTGTRRLQARRAVVLTCGGYEFDKEMKAGYLRAPDIHFYGSPMNSGDGVRMAQAVGADLWHMNSMIGRAVAHFELDGRDYNFLIKIAGGGYVLTDRHGKRFANEKMQEDSRHDFYFELIHYDTERAEYPRIPCYWFFDQRRMQFGPPVSGSAAAGPHRYPWSADSEAEIARGWLHRANSFEELAARAGIADPKEAARTLAAYNEGCRSKADPTKADPFGRPAASLVPLDEPPFYCMPLYPGGSNTSGGPRRNKHAQVLDAFGEPIPGLYEAGELGQAVGALYPAFGASLSDALCFGRIAAGHALGDTS